MLKIFKLNHHDIVLKYNCIYMSGMLFSIMTFNCTWLSFVIYKKSTISGKLLCLPILYGKLFSFCCFLLLLVPASTYANSLVLSAPATEQASNLEESLIFGSSNTKKIELKKSTKKTSWVFMIGVSQKKMK